MRNVSTVIRSGLSPAQKASALTSVLVQEPSEDAVREYAYHLYQQRCRAPGHALDDWLEATACLKANIPPHASQSRLHRHLHGPEGTGPLVSSPAMAKREAGVLRRGREMLEDAPGAADFNMRTSLYDDRS